MISTLVIYMSCQQGTHESLRGNSRALSTVTAIIDGTGSIGVYGICEIDLFCFYKPQKKRSQKKSNKCKSKIKEALMTTWSLHIRQQRELQLTKRDN